MGTGDTVTPSAGAVRPLRALGTACAASGWLGILAAVLTIAYPAAVPPDQWSYPFPFGVAVAVSVLLAVTHLLTLAGFLGVRAADPHRGSRAAGAGLWVAVAGFAGLAIAEVLSGAIGQERTDSDVALAVNAVFGVSSLLTAFGSIVAGAVIARRRVWTGPGRWMVLASGVLLLAAVMPANISGNLVARTVALMLWSLCFVPLGGAISRTEPA